MLHDQVGWVSGHGAFDPAVSAAIIIQQARALQQDIYLLYVDLATFFPSISRSVLRACELWHGVPDDVVDLALLIYGAADDPANAVDCQAVEQVVEWRGGARDREALIRWCGFDPETGEPWEDSWVPRALLSADLRRGGLLREARRRRECAEEGEAGGRQEEDVERRRTPRLAGLVPGPGLGGRDTG